MLTKLCIVSAVYFLSRIKGGGVLLMQVTEEKDIECYMCSLQCFLYGVESQYGKWNVWKQFLHSH